MKHTSKILLLVMFALAARFSQAGEVVNYTISRLEISPADTVVINGEYWFKSQRLSPSQVKINIQLNSRSRFETARHWFPVSGSSILPIFKILGIQVPLNLIGHSFVSQFESAAFALDEHRAHLVRGVGESPSQSILIERTAKALAEGRIPNFDDISDRDLIMNFLMGIARGPVLAQIASRVETLSQNSVKIEQASGEPADDRGTSRGEPRLDSHLDKYVIILGGQRRIFKIAPPDYGRVANLTPFLIEGLDPRSELSAACIGLL